MPDKKENNKIEFRYSENTPVIFTDVISINVNFETVVLELALRDKEDNRATVTNKVIMTLPHFIRFSNICNKSVQNVMAQIEKQKKNKK